MLVKKDPNGNYQKNAADFVEELLAANAEIGAHIDFKTIAANVELLSKAERAVFDLYMKGFSAPDIANQLYISINTIKSHNKRIYKKLNVSSRKELLFFARMMNLVEQNENNADSE